MRFTAALLAAAAVIAVTCANARSINLEPSDSEIAAFVKRNADNLPSWIMENPTREVIRAFLTPATADISHPTGKLSLVLDGANTDVIDATRALEKVVAQQQANTVVTSNPVKPGTIDPSTLWTIGLDVWHFIENNQAVVNATVDWSGAVPKGVTNWTHLTNWENYQSQLYKIEFKNFLGVKLTELQWVFYGNVGGHWNGVGHYLTNVGAESRDIYAIDTEHISATINSLHPVNVGNETNPIAQLTVQNTVNSHGLFKSTTVSCSVTLDGTGVMKIITCAQN